MPVTTKAAFPIRTWCLAHQLPEDQPSSVGLVCPECKRRLTGDPPRGRCLGFWETQPALRTGHEEPRPIFTLVWDDFRIRSLHPPRDIDVEELLREAEELSRSLTVSQPPILHPEDR